MRFTLVSKVVGIVSTPVTAVVIPFHSRFIFLLCVHVDDNYDFMVNGILRVSGKKYS